MFKEKSSALRAGFIGLAAIVLVAAAASIFSFTSGSKATAINADADNVAIHGYDTVAYFTDSKATKGSSEHQHEWQGARWVFCQRHQSGPVCH